MVEKFEAKHVPSEPIILNIGDLQDAAAAKLSASARGLLLRCTVRCSDATALVERWDITTANHALPQTSTTRVPPTRSHSQTTPTPTENTNYDPAFSETSQKSTLPRPS
ncbi:hypothetical protein OPT61_g4291 [Boeremia exigua]|uniref:Uncharacterized protein n=1 Tax=Boeremia exigua TaxID=749465 RepID=A0ACC2IEH9_9PLEO|nr:hypothetical protein OPT61_g4291 [Boeremia exigua]